MTPLLYLTLLPFFYQDAQQPHVSEVLRVVNQLVTVRVLGPDGKALPDLTADRFHLTCNGKPVPVQSVLWLPGGVAPALVEEREQSPEDLTFAPLPDRIQTDHYGFIDATVAPIAKPGGATQPEAIVEKPGRLLVFTVQQDVGNRRNDGLVRTIRQCEGMLEQLEPEDWVAVTSFGSHLKLHLDFSRDRARARAALRRCLTHAPGAILDGGPPPSLAEFLDDDEAERAADLETGLAVLARALRHLPGEKLMTLVGYGVGSLDRMAVVQNRRYDAMIAALTGANVVVCALDLTIADYHSLEVSLMQVAQTTGGFYERTVHHPEAAAKRILEALRGAYQISFSLPLDTVDPELVLTIVGVPNARVSLNQLQLTRH